MNYFYTVSIRNKGRNLFTNNFALLKPGQNINMCSMYVLHIQEILCISVCFASGKLSVREVCQFQGIPLGVA
jgi:hypothetical protein